MLFPNPSMHYYKKKGYIYIAFLENMSITISMYFLVLFYHSIQEELAPFRPIAKFLCIKAIILFSFWYVINIVYAPPILILSPFLFFPPPSFFVVSLPLFFPKAIHYYRSVGAL